MLWVTSSICQSWLSLDLSSVWNFVSKALLNFCHLIGSEETEIFWNSLFHKLVNDCQFLIFDALVVIYVACCLFSIFCLHSFLQYIQPSNLSWANHDLDDNETIARRCLVKCCLDAFSKCFSYIFKCIFFG